MKVVLDLSVYDINEIKDAAVMYWREGSGSEEEFSVKCHVRAFFDFLDKYGFLKEDIGPVKFNKTRAIRKRKNT